MTIDKALYATPAGLPMMGPDVEIEIEDPESVNIDMGDVQIHMEK